MSQCTISSYDSHQHIRLIEIFYTAVHHIDSKIYTVAQKNAWAPYPINYAFWHDRFSMKKPWIAWFDHKVVGFIELDDDGYIDCFYVDPQYQGKGIATCLYNQVFKIAIKRGLSRLYVQASYIAQPIFLHWGFQCIKRNAIQRRDEVLTNFTMDKLIA